MLNLVFYLLLNFFCIPLEKFYIATTKKLGFNRPVCVGGKKECVEICLARNGRGVLLKRVPLLLGFVRSIPHMCTACKGEGEVIKDVCKACHGKKTVRIFGKVFSLVFLFGREV